MSLLLHACSPEEWHDGSAVGVPGSEAFSTAAEMNHFVSLCPTLHSWGCPQCRYQEGIFAAQRGDVNEGTRKAVLTDIFPHGLQGYSAQISS